MYVEVLSQTSSPVGDEPIGANRSSAQELVLPDRTFVLARLMLAAWENNMDGAEENTAHIVIAATQIFLKNILTAIFTRRKGYAVREGTFIYNIGEPVPSSWKRNSTYILRSSDHIATEIIDPCGQVPAIKPNFEEAEQATAFAYACSPQTIPPPLKPVNAADLQHTLKVGKDNLLRIFEQYFIFYIFNVFYIPNRCTKILLVIILFMPQIWNVYIHMLHIQHGKILKLKN